ncbi:MAG: Bacterial domain [Rickettsiales bacterium]|jgi:uncharacterized membrane protein YdbT with pleckstrin-like domain|nr:Bacterial domain [Rickettsiales bacterium]
MMKDTTMKPVYEARLHRSGYMLGLLVLLIGLIISGKPFTTPGIAEPLVAGINALPGALKSFIASLIPLGTYLQQYYLDLFLMVAGIFLMIRFFLERQRTLLVLTPEGIQVEKGIFSTDYREFPLSTLQGIQVVQSPFAMLLGRGTILIRLSTGEVMQFSPVSKPRRFRNKVLEVIEKNQQKNVF